MEPPIDIPAPLGCVWNEQARRWSLTLVLGPGRKYGLIMLPEHTPADWRRCVSLILSQVQ